MKIIRNELLCLIFLLFAVPAIATEVRISAAASLTEVIKKLVTEYQSSHPEAKVLPNFASSGALAKQIIAGAPSDIYISANPKWMEYLQKQGLIATGSEQILVYNSLVFVGMPDRRVTSMQHLPGLERVAIGSPQSAPVGKYAVQALTAAELYPQLLASGKMILAKDVRQALIYADRGEVDGAFVYRTDALLAKQAKILFAVPPHLYPRVSYPIALTEAAMENQSAQQLLAYLLGGEAQQIFNQYGFVIR